MALLDPSNTNRLFIDYEGNFGKRTLQFRYTSADGIDAITSVAYAVLDIVRTFWHLSTQTTGARVAIAGSNVSNPVAFTNRVGTQTTMLEPVNFPRFVSWVGRSSDGRRVRLFVYGMRFTTPDDYRATGTEIGGFQTIRNVLNQNSPPLRTISGLPATFKDYANVGFNSYHERKRRINA